MLPDRSLLIRNSTALLRLAIGLSQGLLLYWLWRACMDGIWPAAHPRLLAPALVVAWFIPLLLSLGLGNLRPRVLLVWAVIAALVLLGLGLHDIARGGMERGWGSMLFAANRDDIRRVPSDVLMFYAGAGLFIAQSLILAGNADRRIIAAYPTYFDAAWKLGVQILLALCFVGAFWALLELGAALFDLIKLDFLQRLIRHAWFSIPATAMAGAAAIHLTDTRAGLIRGLRTLKLTLLSWLLPLITLIVLGFLLSLAATGLKPLWETRYATALLLAVAGALVLLINAVYQDGVAERAAPWPLRIAGSLASLALVPLIGLGSYALMLRVGQHGWTGDRIIAAACLLVGACYAVGYATALPSSGAWMKRLEICNLFTAFVILAVLLALFTPLADPARLSVADQLARLRTGRVAPADFDFAYLRFEGARYGREALQQLATESTGTQAADIRERAEAALQLQYRWQRPQVALAAEEIAGNIAVWPKGAALPDSFLRQDWRGKVLAASWLVPRCVTQRGEKCDALLIDLDGDGTDEIILAAAGGYTVLAAFKSSANGSWSILGTLPHLMGCAESLNALRAGNFSTVPSTWRDVIVAGRRFQLQPAPGGNERCP